MSANNHLETRQGYFSEEDLLSLEYLELPAPKKGRMRDMILKDPITQLNAPKPIVLAGSDPVSKAATLMKKFRYGSVLVQEAGELAGIFTEKDFLKQASGRQAKLDEIPLRDVMTRDPQVLEEEDNTLAHALHLMAVGRYRHIPITKDGHPIGFVSIRGILRYLAENALATGGDA